MSDTPKRTGTRDISELKARLGLQKNRATSRQTDAQGIVPPPGARTNQPMNAPVVPPGAAQPLGQTQELPPARPVQTTEYVVVNDGSPVEGVNNSSTASKAVKVLAGLGILIAGVVLGQVAAGNKRYNGTIEAAATIKKSMVAIGKNLVTVDQSLQIARERGAGGNAFLPNDAKLTEALEALEFADTSTDEVFKSSMYDLPDKAVSQILEFYKESATLERDIANHVILSKKSHAAVAAGEEKWRDALKSMRGVAGLIELPKAQGQPPVLKLVQIGAPVCSGQSSPSPAGCPAGTQPVKFQYRLDANSGSMSTKKVTAAETATAVSGNALIQISPESTVLQQIAKGGEASVAEVGYMTRINSIQERVSLLLEARSVLEKTLAAKAKEGTKFTFFL